MLPNIDQNFKGKRMLEKAEPIDLMWAYQPDPLSKDKQLCLLDNVQFIYELALARMELHSLGARFEITNGLREFKLLDTKETDILKERLAYFKIVKGEYTDYFQIIQKNQMRSVNQYLTHWIYPYKGKFHPQMIRALFNIMGLEPGDTVLDPFIGSGTTAVEAQLLGINCIGIDVSPLCVLQAKVKTESMDALPRILKWKDEVMKNVESSLFNHAEKTLDGCISSISDKTAKNFFKMAKLVAISDQARRGRDFGRAFFKNLGLMVASVTDFREIVKQLDLKLGEVNLEVGDARALPIGDETIDAVVTSPPYSIALDYVANDAHALEELGFSPSVVREEFVGVRGKGETRIDLYNQDMKNFLKEIFRVLKPNKYAVVILGNATYLAQEVKTVEFVIEQAQTIGFKLVKNVDKIIFGLYNIMQKENILIFQKQASGFSKNG